MIGILLKILAVIGWTLLAVIALIVLILLIVLLVPLRYRVEAHGESDTDKIRVNGQLSWLLHLIGVRFSYEDREADHCVRVAWKKLGQEGEDSERAQKKAERKAAREEKKAARAAKKAAGREDRETAPADQSGITAKVEEKTPAKAAAKEEPIVHLSVPGEEFSDDIESLAADSGEDRERDREAKKKAKKEKKAAKKAEKREKKERGERRFRLPDFGRIEEKVHVIGDRKEDILSFLEDRSHRKALSHLLRRLKKTGKKLIPRDWELGGTVGMDDPFTTGRLAAIAGMIFPYTGERVPIAFDFEKKVLDLDGHAAGKLRLGTLAAMILPLLIDRHIWRTIKDALRLKKRFTGTSDQDKGGKAA